MISNPQHFMEALFQNVHEAISSLQEMNHHRHYCCEHQRSLTIQQFSIQKITRSVFLVSFGGYFSYFWRGEMSENFKNKAGVNPFLEKVKKIICGSLLPLMGTVKATNNHKTQTKNHKHCQRHNGPRILSPNKIQTKTGTEQIYGRSKLVGAFLIVTA